MTDSSKPKYLPH
uniref:Uncharacterized protein n=1 Tax=Arundo donax TaxID=35708 RepID=A0A0A9ASB7_ARUDO